MKILVMYDQQGNIRSIGIVSTKSGIQATLQPASGHQIAELEAPEVTDEHDYEHLHAIREHFRVEVAAEQPRLVSKNA